jgi:hypothetical protein
LLPNASSCNLLGDPDVTVLDPKVDAVVPDLTRYLGWPAAALVAMVASAMVLGLRGVLSFRSGSTGGTEQ